MNLKRSQLTSRILSNVRICLQIHIMSFSTEIEKACPMPHFWKKSHLYKPNYASSFKNKPPQIKVTERKIVKS